MAKRKIKKGDAVVVIAGEHKGSEVHKVVAIDTAKNRATIEGVTVKKHSRPSSKHPQGGIIDVPATIHISNLKLVGPDGTPTRVGRRVDEKTGKLERFSIKSEEAIK
ncbi:MAG TPA: 50S ribosomal protein L24 [Bacteroidia bacterium]|nr:50S ribosomal protein L24 [Bacteroidia bacterium]